MNAHTDMIQLAECLYSCYCHAVGWKAFSGDPLPDWTTFAADPAKKQQRVAWLATANAAHNYLSEHDMRYATQRPNTPASAPCANY